MSDLDEIRSKKNNRFATILTVVSGVSMLFIGLPAYFNHAERGVATVNGQNISNDLLQEQRSRIQRANPQLEDENLQKLALNTAIQQVLLQQHAENSPIVVPDAVLFDIVKKQFGDSRNYQEALRQMHTNAKAYESALKQQEKISQYYQLISPETGVGNYYFDYLQSALIQERNYQLIALPIAEIQNKITQDEGELEKFYQQNEALYQSPEAIKLDYVIFRAKDLPAEIKSEDLAKAQSNSGKRAANYLILDKNSRDLAEKTLQDLKNGGDFAALKNQQDLINAKAEFGEFPLQNFGEIGVKEIDEALFQLKNIGEVSAIIETEYGLMILKLSASELLSEEQNKENLLKQAQDLALFELSNRAVELMNNGAKLSEIAALNKTEIQHDFVLNSPQDSELLQQIAPNQVAEFRQQLFGEKALSLQQILEPVVLNDGSYLFATIAEKTPAKTIPYAEIKDTVKQNYLDLQATDLVQEKLSAWENELNAGKTFTDIAKNEEIKLSETGFISIFSDSDKLTQEQKTKLFQETKKLQFLSENDDFYVFALLKEVRDGDLTKYPEGFLEQFKFAMQQVHQERNLENLAQYLQKKADIKINER